MSAIEISKLSLREKFQIMEAIWDDLRDRVDQFEVPQSHKALLDSRRKRVESGKAEVLEWDQVKHRIGQK